MNRKWLLVLVTQIIGCVFFIPPVSVLATPLVSVSSVGGGNFQIEGVGIERAAAFDLTLSYDASVLTNPRVAAGSLVAGGMLEINANTPGVVRIVIMRITPVTGSGLIATLSFNQNGENVGKIHSLNVKLLNIDGQPLHTATKIINLPDPSAKALPTPISSAKTVTENNTPSSNKKHLTTEFPFQPETKPALLVEQETTSVIESDSNKESPDKVAPTEQIIIHKSVLERLLEYSGKRNIESLSELFRQPVSAECSQLPPVALSDGKSQVMVLLTPTTTDTKLSNFVITAAQLISIKKNPDIENAWIANLLPTKGSVLASFAYSQGMNTVVCPLTVAPEVDIDFDKSGSIAEADVSLYFTSRKSKKALRFDLNQNGKQDYLDDYLFVANYLAITNSKKVSASNKPILLSK